MLNDIIADQREDIIVLRGQVAALQERVRRMAVALELTAGNIRSLGPAGSFSDAPFAEYREWLKVVEDAIKTTR